MRFILIFSFCCSLCLLRPVAAAAQELNANVTVNHQQIQQTSTGVFETLETALKAFMNERQWTNLQFKPQERINCNFAITVTKYKDGDNSFECKMMVQSSRPVFNSNYSTTVFNTQDANFNFTFQEYDKLEFRTDVIDNDLTAMMAYYAYLIIGLDMDTMAPEGGTDYLRTAQTICNNAQTLTKSAKGWKAFDDGKTAMPSSMTTSIMPCSLSGKCSINITGKDLTSWPKVRNAAERPSLMPSRCSRRHGPTRA